MPFCTECGNRMNENASFCPNCGHKRFDPGAAEQDFMRHDGEAVSPGGASSGAGAMGRGTRKNKKKKSGAKTAVIIILVTLFILAAIGILAAGIFDRAVISLNSVRSYAGYWESQEVDTGYGFDDELYFYDVEGLYGLQLNEDGTYVFFSAFEDEIYQGEWRETDKGLTLIKDGQELSVIYKSGELHMTINGNIFALERSDRSWDDPTLGPGFYSGGSLPSSVTGAGGNIAGSGDVDDGDFHIAIIGAEEFYDIDNPPSIRIYYEFTNNFEYPESAYNVLDWRAMQDGVRLEETYCWEEDDAYYYDQLKVRPGMSVQCCLQFSYNPKGGSVDLSIFSWNQGESAGVVNASYIPGELPGAPAKYVFKPVTDPKWSAQLQSAGYLDNHEVYAAVTDAELVTDYHGYDAVRIYYEFTNYSTEELYFYNSVCAVTYQDGIGLFQTYTEIDSETDERLYLPVAPGETAVVSAVYRLRNNTSAIEAEVEGANTYMAVGQTYELN